MGKITELEESINLANRRLDDVNEDPDSDLSMMSRQFLRARERIAALEHPVNDIQPMLDHWVARAEKAEASLKVAVDGAEGRAMTTALLEALCKQWDVPFKAKCRECKELHEAQSYKILGLDPDPEEDEVDPDVRGPSILIDYGRCSAMTDPKQCFKTWIKASKEGRAAMKALARSLGGEP